MQQHLYIHIAYELERERERERAVGCARSRGATPHKRGDGSSSSYKCGNSIVATAAAAASRERGFSLLLLPPARLPTTSREKLRVHYAAAQALSARSYAASAVEASFGRLLIVYYI
uniref:Uncharacterized protein n=1 Tax=Trichogramma kaykai TaxID=54128 RepID=A0ABD2XH29_9HYME